MTSSSTHFHQFRLDFPRPVLHRVGGNFKSGRSGKGRHRAQLARGGQSPMKFQRKGLAVAQGAFWNCGLLGFLSEMFCLNQNIKNSMEN